MCPWLKSLFFLAAHDISPDYKCNGFSKMLINEYLYMKLKINMIIGLQWLSSIQCHTSITCVTQLDHNPNNETQSTGSSVEIRETQLGDQLDQVRLSLHVNELMLLQHKIRKPKTPRKAHFKTCLTT